MPWRKEMRAMCQEEKEQQSWSETLHVSASLASWFLLRRWLGWQVMSFICCVILIPKRIIMILSSYLLGKLGFGWTACIQQKKKFLYLYRGYSDKVSNGGGVWIDGSPLLRLLAVLALGLLVLLGHNISEVSNLSQFCSSYLEPCGLMGKHHVICLPGIVINPSGSRLRRGTFFHREEDPKHNAWVVLIEWSFLLSGLGIFACREKMWNFFPFQEFVSLKLYIFKAAVSESEISSIIKVLIRFSMLLYV